MKFEYLEEQEAETGEGQITMESGTENSVGVAAPRSGMATNSYKECMKNHAAITGGHAVDGCGEFMAGGEDGTLECLKCAACSCHRNFHRKGVIEGADTFIPLALHVPVGQGSISNEEGHSKEQQQESPSNPGSKKRFRTKFTDVQKEKMRGFAEKIGWKIQKHDEADMEQFCKDVYVKKHVFKMWLHNNRKTRDKN
ncbi:hypothetical protein ACHQM5_016304 [Ranunculus cassubicifolius]